MTSGECVCFLIGLLVGGAIAWAFMLLVRAERQARAEARERELMAARERRAREYRGAFEIIEGGKGAPRRHSVN